MSRSGSFTIGESINAATRRPQEVRVDRLPHRARGAHLAEHVYDFSDEYDTLRLHQALDWQRPIEAYLNPETLNQKPPETEQQT